MPQGGHRLVFQIAPLFDIYQRWIVLFINVLLALNDVSDVMEVDLYR
jgi:hypothetical protein